MRNNYNFLGVLAKFLEPNMPPLTNLIPMEEDLNNDDGDVLALNESHCRCDLYSLLVRQEQIYPA